MRRDSRVVVISFLVVLSRCLLGTVVKPQPGKLFFIYFQYRAVCLHAE